LPVSSFITASATDVGTSLTTVYTATDTCVLIGLNVANTTSTTVPIDVVMNNGVTDVYIRKNFRIDAGGNAEVMAGNKIVLSSGNTIAVKSGVSNSVDVVLSLLSGV
jgi:hypothetical protein